MSWFGLTELPLSTTSVASSDACRLGRSPHKGLKTSQCPTPARHSLRAVTKYRDRDIQMTCSPQRFRRLGKSVPLTEHVAYPLVCAQFRDGKWGTLAVSLVTTATSEESQLAQLMKSVRYYLSRQREGGSVPRGEKCCTASGERVIVAVNDALLMCSFKRLRNLLRDRQCFLDRDWSLGDAVGERWPLDQFHDERLHTVRLLQAVHMRDVGMIHGGEDLRFSLESGESVRVDAHASGSTFRASSRLSPV